MILQMVVERNLQALGRSQLKKKLKWLQIGTDFFYCSGKSYGYQKSYRVKIFPHKRKNSFSKENTIIYGSDKKFFKKRKNDTPTVKLTLKSKTSKLVLMTGLREKNTDFS